jgi:hypothetical protein
MGLLEKANSFASAKSLLHRSLELLSEEPPARTGPSTPGPPAPADETTVFDVPVFKVRVENPAGVPSVAGGAAEPPAAHRRAADPAAFTEELAGEVSSLEATIDMPSRLFGLLKDRLGISKGALLLHDAPRGVFAPWAAAGYDAATMRRMRIPVEAPVFARLAGSPPVEVSDPKDLADVRRFFSSRESGVVERLLLAPFAAGGRLLGVLLASQIDPPIPAGPPLAGCLGRVAAAALPSLQRLRDESLQPGRAGPASPREAREELTRFLAGHPRGTPPLTVFTLSLDRCRKRVAAANPWFDPFRLEEDLRGAVSVFTADLGRAVHLGRLRFLVAVRDLGPADTDLFAHQLASLLGSLFHATGFEPADAEIGEARTFPDRTEAAPGAAAELLASLAAS